MPLTTILISSNHMHSNCQLYWILKTIPCMIFCTTRQGNSWRFEYNGDSEPFAGPDKEDGSDEMNYTGSTGYRNMMGLDITGNKPFKRPAAMHIVRKIPANCTTDEVLLTVKSAMFEMADWLLQVEAAEASKSDMQDDDLTEDNAHLDTNHGAFSDLYSDPPDYTKDTEGSYLSSLHAEHSTEHQYGSMSRFKGIEEGDENEAIEEEKECRSGDDEEELKGYDSDETSSPPPRYDNNDNDNDNKHSPPTFLPPFHADLHSTAPSQRHTRTHTRVHTRTCRPSDRVSIMFHAFTDASNNSAKWLGKNEKLTRLKFQGGLERVLRLKMTWQQFDSLWTKVDSQRSGDLSFQEFENVFYVADNESSSEGTVLAYVTFLLFTALR